MSLADAYGGKIGDSCGQFFQTCLRACDPRIPDTASVLEIGCAEWDWLAGATKAWPAMTFTGIDWRGHSSPSPATVIQGDVITATFPPESFDWIVSISAMEHIGLGHYDRDPQDPDGDMKAFANAYRWLKPGGWFYFDVPYNIGANAYEVCGTSHRVYDDLALERRCHQGLGWTEVWRGLAGTGDTDRLVTEPERLKGGERFYYCGCWYRKA